MRVKTVKLAGTIAAVERCSASLQRLRAQLQGSRTADSIILYGHARSAAVSVAVRLVRLLCALLFDLTAVLRLC